MSAFRDSLVRALKQAGVVADVVLTDNRSTLVSVAKKTGVLRGGRPVTLEVRVARRFAALGPPAVEAVVGFATGRRGARARLLALIRQLPRDETIAGGAAPRRRVALEARGEVYDLALIAEGVRAEWFPDVAPVPIGWGRGRSERGKKLRTIRLGSYEPIAQVIRVHPRLDDARVPEWVIAFIIFHEYLHHVLGVAPKGESERRAMHTREFREREALHPHYRAALAWEAANLPTVLSTRW